jgi:alpha-amylase
LWNTNRSRFHHQGVDYDNLSQKASIYKICGDNKSWNKDVDGEKGNFDYLMGADIDYAHPDVRQEVKRWGAWVIDELGIEGFR